MASEVQKLQQNVVRLADDAKKTAGQLTNFNTKFASAVNKVQATIGSTSTGTDKQMIETLQQAEKEVKEAVAALEQAAKTANDYAASL